ncbi:hypothetical protein F4821DRAFT_107493 [Hypoxylon rubiginosum]|uniref:Uncharacterized protein n=1 Tax=Hypoxylon rubiginosum TaxID=110542 RepID=A0ACC0D3T4_9PEZI|nr:hypothetical protein F4821DRAFT_107493 [Hypoxylon rubiginosum]
METTAANPNKRGEVIIPTPSWFIAIRVFQIVLALVVVAMTGWWIHGLYYDELGFVIVCGLFTWIIAIYALLAERVVSCRRAYNTWAILALDLLMIIFWLAAMAATANRRSKFTVPVSADCVSDGSTVNSGHCIIEKRVVGVATNGALGVLSGIAGVSALIMLLFIPTFAYVCHYFRLSLAGHSTNDPEKPGVVPGPAGATELQGGMAPQTYQQSQPFPNQQTGYSQQPVGQQQFQQGPVYDPYAPQNTGYDQTAGYNAGAAGAYEPQHVPANEQQYTAQGAPAQGHPYSPQGTPAPGQPYQPPYQPHVQQ